MIPDFIDDRAVRGGHTVHQINAAQIFLQLVQKQVIRP